MLPEEFEHLKRRDDSSTRVGTLVPLRLRFFYDYFLFAATNKIHILRVLIVFPLSRRHLSPDRCEAARLSILWIVNDTKTGKLEIRSKLSPWNPLYQFRIGVWNSLRIIKDVSSLSFVRFDAILNAFLDFLIVLKCNKLCFVKHNEIRKITYNFSQYKLRRFATNKSWIKRKLPNVLYQPRYFCINLCRTRSLQIVHILRIYLHIL